MTFNVFDDSIQIGDLVKLIIGDVQAELMFQFQNQVSQL